MAQNLSHIFILGDVGQGLAKYDTQAKFGLLLPVTVNKVLLEYGHIHLFSAYAAKLSSCNSDSVARKAENIYYPALYKKGLRTPL